MEEAEFLKLRGLPVSRLALLLAARKEPEADFLLRQAEGWQRMRTKVPAWAATDGLHYPPRLSLEQCSGEAAARYKASVAQRLLAGKKDAALVDLTGGMGVDFSFVSRHFARAVYAERQETLCAAARHNFPLLGLPEAEVVCGDGTDYLREMAEADIIYIDPARRDTAGRKTVRISDCEPDVVGLKDLLLSKARVAVMVKLSPMLDITEAARELGCVSEAHVVAADGECKDLLLVLRAGAGDSPALYAAEDGNVFRFTAAEEAAASVAYADEVGAYLYEPGAAMMKAGAFKLCAARYGLEKLHPNSHLYTSARLVTDFPGRAFAVRAVYGFGKKEINALRRDTPQANIATRNFPTGAEALRKKLKLRDGGKDYIFATTLRDGRHALVCCEKCAPPACTEQSFSKKSGAGL